MEAGSFETPLRGMISSQCGPRDRLEAGHFKIMNLFQSPMNEEEPLTMDLLGKVERGSLMLQNSN